MNNNNMYFSCFSLIRACVSSLFDNFFKVVAVCLIVCFVLISPAAAYASTTESMMMFSVSNDDYGVMPLSLNSEYGLRVSSAFLDVDSSNIYGTSSIVSGGYQNLQDGYTNTLFSSQTGVFNSSDYLAGYILDLYDVNTASRVSDIPTLFNSSYMLDLGYFRNFLQINNYNYDLYTGAVPVVAYADVDLNYSYSYRNESNVVQSSYDNNLVLRLPISVSCTNFDELGSSGLYGGHYVHIDLNGYKMDDIIDSVSSSNGYLSNLVKYRDSIERFTSSTNNVKFYVFYNFSDFYNYTDHVFLNTPTDSNFVQYVGMQYWNNVPFHLNFIHNSYILNNEVSFVNNLQQSIKYMFTTLSGNLGSVVQNATDNANRIIQNTTQKVDEVKQGVTAVKDSVVETKNSILDLPNKIKDMLLGLIIPSDEDIAGKYDEFSSLLEAKLGVIYQIPAMILELFQTLLSGVTDPQTTLTFPKFHLRAVNPWQRKRWES